MLQQDILSARRGGEEMDGDLLLALDDVLALAADPLAMQRQTQQQDVQPVAADYHFTDVFGVIASASAEDAAGDAEMDALLLEIPQLLAGDDPPQLPATPVQQRECQVKVELAPSPATVTQPEPPQTKRGKAARAAPYPKTKPRRRKRPKDELDYLRAKVTDLEDELSKLGQKNAAARNGGHSPESGSSSEDDEVFVRWKKIADRQKEEANSSVIENLKLRAMLEGQLQVARTLEAAISQHQKEAVEVLPWPRAEASVGTATLLGMESRSFFSNMPDELLFAELDTSLDAQYAEVDDELAANGLAGVCHEVERQIQLKSLPSGSSFQHVEVRILPFPMRAVHEAMWSCLSESKVGEVIDCCRTQLVNNDSLHTVLKSTLQLPKSRCTSVTARISARQYFETERVVVVWNAYVEIDGSVFVRLHEKGWMTTSSTAIPRRSGPSALDDTAPGCILRSAVRVTPELAHCDSEQDVQAHIGEMTDLIVGTYHRNFGLMYQVVENLLSRDATTHGGGSSGDARTLDNAVVL